MDEVSRFITLFRGRGDCYGSWEGGCVRKPLTHDLFRKHLDGIEKIGVYPAMPHNGNTMCVWGCTDIDYDNVDHPKAIQQALAAKQVTSWLEKTRKGWHLWVFSERLIEASHMRRMFLAAHQVAGVPAKEVNPKQEHLSNGQVGNYVRLPYPGGITERRIVEPTSLQPYSLEVFTEKAWAQRTPPEVIINLASYWQPPAAPAQITTQPTHDMMTAAAALSPLGRVIFRDGPLPDRDRSSTLLRLAYECHTAGLAPEDCLLIMEDADLRWGKFMIRPNGQQELVKMIWKAYGCTPNTSP